MSKVALFLESVTIFPFLKIICTSSVYHRTFMNGHWKMLYYHELVIVVVTFNFIDYYFLWCYLPL